MRVADLRFLRLCSGKNRLPNISLWADNPAFHRHEHRSGILSAVWMALKFPFIGRKLVSEGVRISHIGDKPFNWLAHFFNIIRNPIELIVNAFSIVYCLYIKKPRQPGFLIRNSSGRYALHYHSEQIPSKNSRIVLLENKDLLDVPFVGLELKHLKEDAEMILRAHEILDADLRQAGMGHLVFHSTDRQVILDSIMAQAADGFHQCGGLRIGADALQGVIDTNCQVFGVKNLFIASSAAFPTSGQANSTWLTVVLALRVAEHLAASILSEQKR